MLPAGSRVLKTNCLDKACENTLFIHPSEKIIECFKCGQKHNQSSFQDIQEVLSDDVPKALQNYIYRLCIHKSIPRRGTEFVKVLGLSNYHCKILSPLLTRYGMDKNTKKAKLLTEMNQGEIFDCSLLRDRAFLIDPGHINIDGFGKDITGSVKYLEEILKLILDYNGGEERLIPVHADGDGHCLVHAISRALVGRELFWHPLRCCLKKHFQANLDKYKGLFRDFIDTDEWSSIIEECDPDFQPPEGELHGLRNIHIFGLANVLRRPIILLDSLECMQKCGDYSALFLPGFVSPELCKGKDNTLNKPLCIAWSSLSHNHYIPLVGIQKRPLPSLPAALIPKVWGMPQNQISLYMEFDNNGGCIIGGNRSLSNEYIQHLITAMNALYYEKKGVHPLLVADAKLYLYPDNVLFCENAKPAVVLERVKNALQECRLYRCLVCGALCEMLFPEDKYSSNNSAVCSPFLQNFKKMQDSNMLSESYMRDDQIKRKFGIDIQADLRICSFCAGNFLRRVTSDGTVIYEAQDKEKLDRNIRICEPSKRYYPDDSISQKSSKEYKSSRATGQTEQLLNIKRPGAPEYRNQNKKRPLKLVWDEKEIEDEIPFESFDNGKANLNQSVKDLSKKLIEKHFSAHSTNTKLQEYVVEEIWKAVKKYDLKSSSDSSSKQEFMKQDSAKSILKKLEAPITYHSKPSEFQYIKVCTSDGLQANFALTEDGVSFSQLQEWIKNEFNIPIKNQVIKKGVPPRLIKSSGDTNKQILTDLKHGDRLIVEVQKRDSTPYSSNTHTPPRNVLKDSNVPKTSVKYTTDAKWDSIVVDHNSFRKGGSMYERIVLGDKLNYKMHGSLDDYPDKVFCYNKNMDSVELCVKPLGHFLISKDLGDRIEEVKSGFFAIGYSECPLDDESVPIQNTEEFSDFMTVESFNDQEELTLVRKGPGFSVLRKPDNMDLS